MGKSKKILYILCLLVVFIITIGVSFAFFNYTKISNANVIKVGRVDFISNQNETINLVNIFPVDLESDDDVTEVDTFNIAIVGDTDYDRGIEYLISSVETNITTTNGITLPIGIDIETTNLGVEDKNYFTSRTNQNATIYKKLAGGTLVGDQRLLVGFIKKNTTAGTAEGVNGTITVKAYVDASKIAISRTYDGSESDSMGTENEWVNGRMVISPDEWNNLQTNGLSFRVKVEANEGIWVDQSIDDVMRTKNINTVTNQPIMDNVSSEFVSANTGIDFSQGASNTNGKGIYMRAGTENNDYPILYYRGDISDNNVIFGGFCWKMVRTTETGGVKLLYNGETSEVTVPGDYSPIALSQYNIVTNTDGTNNNVFTFDSTDNSWNLSYMQQGIMNEISFNVPAGTYQFVLTGYTGATGSGGFTVYRGATGEDYVGSYGGADGNDLSKNYSLENVLASEIIKFTYNGGDLTTPTIINFKMLAPEMVTRDGCNSTGTASQITLDVNGTDTNLFKYNNSTNSLAYSGYMYGTVYQSYSRTQASGIYYGRGFTWDGTNYRLTDTRVGSDDTHLYTCNSTSAEATCTNLRYLNKYSDYYIILQDGKSGEDAMREMQTNSISSNAKQKIDSWYASNMLDVSDKLEDTIWCNDRSSTDTGGWTYNGFIFSPNTRATNISQGNGNPNLSCINKNDRFTVNNAKGNKALTYPVALLTSDEAMLAGATHYGSNNTYLSGGMQFWTMSPAYFYEANATVYIVSGSGVSPAAVNFYDPFGLRPAISLKHSTPIVSGTGTATDPYVVR